MKKMRLKKGTIGTAAGDGSYSLSLSQKHLPVLACRLRTEPYPEAGHNCYLAKYRGGQKHFLLFLKGGKKKNKGDVLIILKGREKMRQIIGGRLASVS